ncbi:unnamed protein product [Ranitomeya imitator]|uniref:Uncharacterized protein n=1 Tax=Ranitomeya imitator TaxID=111125 RepID=A0ABN9M7R1_9NEOB|nr:unnamed protein product [Ranitomeya imitator]
MPDLSRWERQAIFLVFFALSKEEKEMVAEYPVDEVHQVPQWNEKQDCTCIGKTKAYHCNSRLHKWAKKVIGNGTDGGGTEMALLAVRPFETTGPRFQEDWVN